MKHLVLKTIPLSRLEDRAHEAELRGILFRLAQLVDEGATVFDAARRMSAEGYNSGLLSDTINFSVRDLDTESLDLEEAF